VREAYAPEVWRRLGEDRAVQFYDLFTRSGYASVVLSNYTDGRTPLREAIRAMVP